MLSQIDSNTLGLWRFPKKTCSLFLLHVAKLSYSLQFFKYSLIRDKNPITPCTTFTTSLDIIILFLLSLLPTRPSPVFACRNYYMITYMIICSDNFAQVLQFTINGILGQVYSERKIHDSRFVINLTVFILY